MNDTLNKLIKFAEHHDLVNTIISEAHLRFYKEELNLMLGLHDDDKVYKCEHMDYSYRFHIDDEFNLLITIVELNLTQKLFNTINGWYDIYRPDGCKQLIINLKCYALHDYNAWGNLFDWYIDTNSETRVISVTWSGGKYANTEYSKHLDKILGFISNVLNYYEFNHKIENNLIIPVKL